MALDKDMFILRTMVHELESIGYAVEERVVDTSQYGVPQFRQRLILVALSGQDAVRWPPPSRTRSQYGTPSATCPSVEGGWRPEGGADGWADYDGPRTASSGGCAKASTATTPPGLRPHHPAGTRGRQDRLRSRWTSETRYSDLPEELRRYRADIFDDKYKRLE